MASLVQAYGAVAAIVAAFLFVRAVAGTRVVGGGRQAARLVPSYAWRASFLGALWPLIVAALTLELLLSTTERR